MLERLEIAEEQAFASELVEAVSPLGRHRWIQASAPSC